MKKSLKSKSPAVPAETKPDITDLIIKIQQQLIFLEKKIDTLIIRTPERSFEANQSPKPLPRPEQPRPQGEVKQVNPYRERVLHKAICADCNKGCEVPFKPSLDRPVYCKECFSKRKSGGPFKANNGNRPAEVRPVSESPAPKHHSAAGQKSVDKPAEKSVAKSGGKKKPVSKKRKK